MIDICETVLEKLEKICEKYSDIFDDVPTLSIFLYNRTRDVKTFKSLAALESLATLMSSIRYWADDFSRKGKSKAVPLRTSSLYPDIICSGSEGNSKDGPMEPTTSVGFYLDPPEVLAVKFVAALIEHFDLSTERGDKPLAKRLKARSEEYPEQAKNLGLLVFAILLAYIGLDEVKEGHGDQEDMKLLVHPNARRVVRKIIK